MTYSQDALLVLLAAYLAREAKGEQLVFVEWTEDLNLPYGDRAYLEAAYLGVKVLPQMRAC